MKIYANCDKCQSKWQEVFEFNGQWLGKACLCYQEELEKRDPKIDTDLQNLDNYRALCAGTKNIPPSSY